MKSQEKIKIAVYLDCGLVFEYTVPTEANAREHASAIIQTGYRHTSYGSDDLEWYPPHRITKVKVYGGSKTTKYKDDTRVT